MQPLICLFMTTVVILCVHCCSGFGVTLPSNRPSTSLRQLQLALTASAQFQMILSLTATELQFEALEVVKLVLASFILEEKSYHASTLSQSGLTTQQALVSTEEITDVEIVIQESEFQKELSTTQIQFFAVATFVETADNASSETRDYRQIFMNSLIEQSFSADTKRSQFISNLQLAANASRYSAATARQLQDVDTLVVTPVAPVSEPSSSTNDRNMGGGTSDTDSSSELSVLDKIIIAISCGICGGLFVLLFWHLRDVGHFIAATRHQLFLQNDNTMGSFPQMPRFDDEDKSEGESANTGSPHFVTTSFMSDENPDATVGIPGNRLLGVVSCTPNHSSTMTTPLSDFPILAMDGPEFESHEDLSTASFETNLFQSETKVAPLGIRKNDMVDQQISQDVSQADNDTDAMRSPAPMDASSQTLVRSSDDRIGAAPVSYFVPIDPEEGTAEEESVQRLSDENSQVDDSEDDFSLPLFTAVDVSSIGHLSLEQSMASSTPPTL
jgi:hypothetical protein